MKTCVWILATVGAITLGVILVSLIDTQDAFRPALLSSRLRATGLAVEVYHSKRGVFPANLRALEGDGFDLSEARDPYSASGDLLGYSRVTTATGEKCELYTALFPAAAKILWGTSGGVTYTFSAEFEKLIGEYRGG